MGLFGTSNAEDAAMDELAKNQALYSSIEVPKLDWKEYVPELYQTESSNYDLVKEDPVLRSKQLTNLDRLAGLSEDGLSDVDKAGYAKAVADGQQVARQGNEAALLNAQARGVAGGGLEFAMKEMANQGGAQAAQTAALQQAADAARQRALYTQAYGDQLNSTRGQDFQANSTNSNIINDFNKSNTAQRNETAVNNVNSRNQAQQYNNQGANNTKQQNFNNEITRAGGIAGANTAAANGYAAQDAAQTAQQNQWLQIGAAAATGGASLAATAAAKKGMK